MVDSLENIVTSAQAFVDEMEMDEVNYKVEQLNRKNIKKSVASVFRHSSKEDMFKSMRKSIILSENEIIKNMEKL